MDTGDENKDDELTLAAQVQTPRAADLSVFVVTLHHFANVILKH